MRPAYSSCAEPPENGAGHEWGRVDSARLLQPPEPTERAHLEREKARVGLDEIHAREEQAEPGRRAQRELDRLGRRVGLLVAPPGQDRGHPLLAAGHAPVGADVLTVEHRHAEITA